MVNIDNASLQDGEVLQHPYPVHSLGNRETQGVVNQLRNCNYEADATKFSEEVVKALSMINDRVKSASLLIPDAAVHVMNNPEMIVSIKML